MADSNFSLGAVKSFVDRFFKLFNNFIDGYSVKGDKVTKESGGVRSTIVLKTKEGPDLRVDLIATNVGSVFKQTLKQIDELTLDKRANFDNFVGSGSVVETIDNSGATDYSGSDITLKTAMKKGEAGQDGGLLGIDLNTVAKKGLINKSGTQFSYWKDQAFEKLRYTLICEAGTADAGKVTNIKLIEAPKYIYQYIDIINGVASEDTQKQQTRNQKIKSQQNIKTSALILVIPILATIQQELRNKYQDRLNSETSLDVLIPKNAEAAKKNATPDEFDETAMKKAENDAAKAAKQSQQSQQNQGGNPTATQHINVTLKKIQASDDLAILRLESNYTPGETLSDLDEIINQDEFLNTLTEEPQAFAIEVDEDGFDIEPCEECPQCNPCESLCEVFKAAIRAYRNLYIIHWMSAGDDMMKLHILAEEMYGELIQEIDTLGELLVEKQGTVPQLDFPCDYVPVQKYEFQGSLETIKSLVQMYIDCIDYAYPNQTSDVQSTLDEWLRYWNKQMNYFIKNQEEQ